MNLICSQSGVNIPSVSIFYIVARENDNNRFEIISKEEFEKFSSGEKLQSSQNYKTGGANIYRGRIKVIQSQKSVVFDYDDDFMCGIPHTALKKLTKVFDRFPFKGDHGM